MELVPTREGTPEASAYSRSQSIDSPGATITQSNVGHKDSVVEEYTPYYDHYLEALVVFVYFARYVLLLTTICLFIISLMYGISSLVTLEATNFFCPLHSEEEVRQHNLENGLEHGDDQYSCWYINRSVMNLMKIIMLEDDLFEATFKNFTIINLFKCLLYCLVSLCLLIIILYNGYYVIYDTFFALVGYFNSKLNCQDKYIHNPRLTKTLTRMRYKVKTRNKLRRKQIVSRSKLKQFNEKNGRKQNRKATRQSKFGVTGSASAASVAGAVKWVISKYQQWAVWYRKYYYHDSKWRLFTIMGKEWIEILVQTYGLLLFGGIDIFDSESNVLAQDSSVVRQFSIIVGMNCIIAGAAQLGYIVFGNFIRGNVFLTIYFVIDTAFECAYILFPLLSLNNNNNNNKSMVVSLTNPKALAMLTQENNGFILLQSLLAIIFVSSKALFLMGQLNPKNIIIKHWRMKLLKRRLHLQNLNNPNLNNKRNSLLGVPWIHKSKANSGGDDELSTRFEEKTLYTAITLEYVRERRKNRQQTNGTNRQTPPRTRTTTPSPPPVAVTVTTPVTATSNSSNTFSGTIQTVPINELAMDVRNVSSGSTTMWAGSSNDSVVASTNTSPETSCTVKQVRFDTIQICAGDDYDENESENPEIEKEIYKTDEESNMTQFKRKGIVLLCGLLYITVGLIIMITFTSFIDNDFNEKCVNMNENINNTYTNNSDILYTSEMRYYYNKYCSKKSIRMFDEYPCNCRQLNVNESEIATPAPFKFIESMVSKFDNLEKIWMHGPRGDGFTRAQYNFTSDMIKNLNHLKIFFLEDIDMHYISQDISKLSNLEIFFLKDNEVSLFLPLDDGISHLCMFYILLTFILCFLTSLWHALFSIVLSCPSCVCVRVRVCLCWLGFYHEFWHKQNILS